MDNMSGTMVDTDRYHWIRRVNPSIAPPARVGKHVEIGCLNMWMSVAAEVTVSQIVGQHHNDVGTLRGFILLGRQSSGKENAKENQIQRKESGRTTTDGEVV